MLLGAGAAPAETVEEFYHGKVITVTWAGEEGGSYDAYARLFAKHMHRFIPGNPTLVMRYMPGGGGLRYANYVPVSEPADGLYIGIMNYSTFPYRYLFLEQAKYNPETFSHIGSMAVVNTVISALRDKTDEKGVKTVRDVENTEIIMAATGRGSQSYQDVAVVNKLIGTRFKLISGYPGAAQAVLAVERGEVDGFAITWDGWVTRRPQWLAENKLLHFVQFGEPTIPGLDDIPLVNSLDQHAHRGWNMDYQALPPIDLHMLSEPDPTAEKLLAAIERRGGRRSPAWRDRAADSKQPAPQTSTPGFLSMADLAAALRTATQGRDVTLATTPSGWTEDLWPVRHPLDYLGRDGGGGIGTGPGKAVGAALALRGTGRLAVSVMGDGNFLMGLTAIWTAVHYRIPILMVAANNRSFFNDETHQGIVARHRDRPFDNKWIGQRISDPDADIAKLVEGQGGVGLEPIKTHDERPIPARQGIAG